MRAKKIPWALCLIAACGCLLLKQARADPQLIRDLQYSIFETKYIRHGLFEHRVRYVKLEFTVGSALLAHMHDGAQISPGSFNFAVFQDDTQVPGAADWMTPCGGWAAAGEADLAYKKTLYAEAMQQECCVRKAELCVNPFLAVSAENKSEFWFPIGVGREGEGGDGGVMGENFSVWVDFNVSVSGWNESNASVYVFMDHNVDTPAFTLQCGNVTGPQNTAEVFDLRMHTRKIADQEQFEPSPTTDADELFSKESVFIYPNTELNSFITISIEGKQDVFEDPDGSKLYIEIEELTSLHFLDEEKFTVFKELIEAGNAYSVVHNSETDSVYIQFNNSVLDMCNEEVIPGSSTASYPPLASVEFADIIHVVCNRRLLMQHSEKCCE
jgi:hypothetical protein